MRCAADAWAEAARYATGASEKRRNENSGTKATGAAAVWESKERKYKKFTILEGKSQSM